MKKKLFQKLVESLKQAGRIRRGTASLRTPVTPSEVVATESAASAPGDVTVDVTINGTTDGTTDGTTNVTGNVAGNVTPNVPGTVRRNVRRNVPGNERQRWLLDKIAQDTDANADAIALRFGVTKKTALRDIADFKAKQMIELVGPSKKGSYKISNPR